MEAVLQGTGAQAGWDGQGRAFREAVFAEARNTWAGRMRWLWLLLGLAAIGYASVAPVGFDSVGFSACCALACWVPAWLGADLLAIRFRKNPEPLREWAPREFLARAVGRIAPFLGAQVLWLATFTGRSLWERLAQGGPQQFVDPLYGVTSENLAWWCVAWIAVFSASGMPYFAAAALMSSTARRPRPLVVTPLVVLVGGTALLVATRFAAEIVGQDMRPFDFWVWQPARLLGDGNLWVGLWSYDTVDRLLAAIGLPLPKGFEVMCWITAVLFLLYALPALALTWLVASRRYRRSHIT